ncbi:MAG: deoxyribodipyrimidine photo-lyase [Nitrosomonadales bacterium]|nr:deoxyribodipyrimidine photo-lyase [Nitrosomonadales bacterium]
MTPPYHATLCWFRRDLRLDDHAALYHALKSSRAVHCVFVFDTEILDTLPERQDRRVEFIWYAVQELAAALQQAGGALHVLHGRAVESIPALAQRLGVAAVLCNRDYEPAAQQRDAAVAARLQAASIEFHDFKDQVIFEHDEILSAVGTPYSVFTPYKNAWLKRVDDFQLRSYDTARHFAALAPEVAPALPSLREIGFAPCDLTRLKLPLGSSGAARLLQDFIGRIDAYHETRDFPAVKGVSYLAAHLRFGTLSIRRLAALAYYRGGNGAQTYLSELIWRDFYQMILAHHPRLAAGRAFKPQFEALTFPNDMGKFQAWCAGRTGYPLVDAAMRQLNQTGYMHNRLRMVSASFLVKDLHVDWRWGERYFAERLLDYDFAANNGGWQWCASTGCDAQPWFRIFNPVTQSERFDPQGKFIRRYLPELAACPELWIHAPWLMPTAMQHLCTYWPPIVDHARARQQTLEIFGARDTPI